MKDKFGPQQALLPQPVPRTFSDHAINGPHGIQLGVRVWPADASDHPSEARRAPWMLWSHGGAYSAGSHYAPPSWVVPGFTSKNIHVVSAAYRLAPHASLAEQIDDLVRAHDWCRHNLPRLLGLDKVDIDRFGVGGDSAGGTHAMLLGLKLNPPPKVVVDVYGNVDLLAPHHWRHNLDVEWTNTEISLETVRENLQQPDPSDAALHAPFPWELANIPEKTTQHRWAAPDFTYSDRVRRQTAIKDYLALSKLGIPYLVRVDHDAPLQQQQAVARKWSPLQLLDEHTTFPPSALLHGTADQAVPLDMSRQLACKLRQLGVEVLESYEDGGPHAFDQIYVGPDVPGWNEYILPVLNFAASHLNR
ncbi:hypothetical protein EHS25_000833 [Saitozyma podzolica]|uniref:Alpha/beta hydrolase fold-3 domain-containing protein n=1 Tax=Saitozyma podzolica TaxID=1890683 RepID=A0A427YXD5_9TREE|nr:hypothetical protein EHS25_000833 [Saitozyma podzolica]